MELGNLGGRTLWLKKLLVRSIYENVLEADPRQVRGHTLLGIGPVLQRHGFCSDPHVVVPPPEAPPMPRWMWVAELQSEPVRDKYADYSFVVVVFFRDQIDLPIAATVVEAARGLDWDALAEDYTM